MINGFRLVGLGLSLVGLTAVCPLVVSAQVSSGKTMYACVRLDQGARQPLPVRIVAAGQLCRPNETRMILVASKTLLFLADGVSDRTAGPADPGFVSKIIPTMVSVPKSAPLFIGVTLQVDTDNGMSMIPQPSGRGMSSSLECVPLVDEQPAGPAQPLSSDADAIARRSVSGMVDPRTGRFEQLAPGYFPDTMWSVLREYRGASTGRHEVAVMCEAPAAFRFRGVATLVALQQVQ
ncbi:MAG: hypothetical protein ACLQU2_15455 [Candidatus Binataceae bacterium]